MKFATAYDSAKEREARSNAAGFRCVGDSLTVQADAKDADINFIMERYARTGQLPGLSRLPSYGDFEGVSDYREALDVVREADSLFMQLPAKVRSRFSNDPAAFVEFCQDPLNKLELADLGLLDPEVSREVRREAEAARAVKENPTDGEAAPGGAVRASGRQPAKGPGSRGAEGGETT